MKLKKLTYFEIALFPILAGIMLISKVMLEFLPNIHMLGMLIMVYTVTFREKALIPIYLFVFIYGIIWGFNIWWIPYLYIWTVLWGVTMLIPKNLPLKFRVPIYTVVCALHGLFYGTLYAPFQAIAFGLNFKGTLAWILAGLPFDIMHCAGNFVFGLFIVPLSDVLKKSTNKFI